MAKRRKRKARGKRKGRSGLGRIKSGWYLSCLGFMRKAK